MFVGTHELNIANCGLHGLDEVSFLRLYATTQTHALVAGTGRILTEITTAQGVVLYPAFYRTRVRVPPPLQFDRYRSWRPVDIGIHLERFGRMLLHSFGAVAPTGTLPSRVEQCDPAQLIHVEGDLIFVHDSVDADEPTVDAPAEGAVADLPALRKRPAALDEQRRIRSQGAIRPEFSGTFRLREPLEHSILLGRDVQMGRAMLFASFTTLFEAAEQVLLVEHVWPPFHAELLAYRHLLEREIYYYGNIRLGEAALVDVSAQVTACPPELTSAYDGLVGVAVLELRSEAYERSFKRLLAAAHTRKLIAVPRTQAVQDAERWLRQHAGRSHQTEVVPADPRGPSR